MQAVKLARQLGTHRSSQADIHSNLQQQHDDMGTLPLSGLLVPIFLVSSVTGVGLPVLHAFLNALPALPHASTPLLESSSEVTALCLGTNPQHDAITLQGPRGQAAGAVNGHSRAAAKGPINGHQQAETGEPSNGHQQADARAVADGQQRAGARDSYGSHQKADVMNRQLRVDSGSPSQSAVLTHFQVDHTFEVKGVGCVVSGTVVSGEVAVGQKLNLGPTGVGGFREVQVTCIHRSQVHLSSISSPPQLLILA